MGRRGHTEQPKHHGGVGDDPLNEVGGAELQRDEVLHHVDHEELKPQRVEPAVGGGNGKAGWGVGPPTNKVSGIPRQPGGRTDRFQIAPGCCCGVREAVSCSEFGFQLFAPVGV